MTTLIDDKLDKHDFDLFKAIEAVDRKDYNYWDTLTPEQQRKFVPFMMILWCSAVSGSKTLQTRYLRNFSEIANPYLFNEKVYDHPKLQWLTLCAASPGFGKKYHQWIPSINKNVALLKERPKLKDLREYFAKIYQGASTEDIEEISSAYYKQALKKLYIAEQYPNLKHDDIEILASLITDKDIEEHEKNLGN